MSLTALYDKVNRTESAVLRALVQASAARRTPAMAGLGQGAILPGWQVRVLDGNHLPGTEKRMAPLRGHRDAALPGQAVVGLRPRQRPGARHAGGRGRPSDRARAGGWGIRLTAAKHEALITFDTCQAIQKRLHGVAKVPARADMKEEFLCAVLSPAPAVTKR